MLDTILAKSLQQNKLDMYSHDFLWPVKGSDIQAVLHNMRILWNALLFSSLAAWRQSILHRTIRPCRTNLMPIVNEAMDGSISRECPGDSSMLHCMDATTHPCCTVWIPRLIHAARTHPPLKCCIHPFVIWPVVDMPPSSLQAHQSQTLIQILLQRHRERYPRLLQWRNLLPAPSP
ncbi:hypothetical protein BDR05DRAFT_82643 [Suillus weaverae]|nr:hypothetical protein BDR05DRAFT_82643 [Suillus weaverae]